MGIRGSRMTARIVAAASRRISYSQSRWGSLREEKMQKEDQEFSFGYAKFQTSFRHPSRDVKKRGRYMGLGCRKEVWVGNTNLGVYSI